MLVVAGDDYGLGGVTYQQLYLRGFRHNCDDE